MRSLLIALWLGLAMTLSAGYASDSEESPAVEGVELQAGAPAPNDGLLLSLPEVRALDRILADLEGRARVAEAKVSELTLKLESAQAGLSEASARLAGAVATIEVERSKRPTFLESHFGGCIGVGIAGNMENASWGLAGAWGWKF